MSRLSISLLLHPQHWRYWHLGPYTHLPTGFAGETPRGGAWVFCLGPVEFNYAWKPE
jgi:hypothetical protein